MYISMYVIYALVIVAILIFARQFFVLARKHRSDQDDARTWTKLFSRRPRPQEEIVDEHIETRKRIIIDRAYESGGITNDDVQALFNVSHTTAWRYLEELEKEGRLRQEGETGRGVVYMPTSGSF